MTPWKVIGLLARTNRPVSIRVSIRIRIHIRIRIRIRIRVRIRVRVRIHIRIGVSIRVWSKSTSVSPVGPVSAAYSAFAQATVKTKSGEVIDLMHVATRIYADWHLIDPTGTKIPVQMDPSSRQPEYATIDRVGGPGLGSGGYR